jgi:NADPH:quinone reductase-like Zn-dependent oxidoreductase
VLQVAEVPMPTLGRGEVRVRIHATAVTSSDCFVRGFQMKPSMWIPGRLVLGVTRPRKPILGMVLAGDIDAVGGGVTSFEVGQPVFGFDRFGFGTYAQYKTMPAGGVLATKPTNLSYEQAAAIPYGGLLARHFLKNRLASGQRVMIYGASGAVGCAAVQLAKHAGAHVTAVCGPANLGLVTSLGADEVIDYTSDHIGSRGGRYDVVFVAVGNRVGPPSRRDVRDVLVDGGAYLAVDRGRPVVTAADLRLLGELAENGHLTPVIDRTYPLAQIADAHRYVETGHKKGNVVITVATPA